MYYLPLSLQGVPKIFLLDTILKYLHIFLTSFTVVLCMTIINYLETI